jgi:hypothetical protein
MWLKFREGVTYSNRALAAVLFLSAFNNPAALFFLPYILAAEQHVACFL